ncbi:MAG: hypothetical protein ACTHU0_06735 [Kofleriaceae bacterium]
MHEAIEWCTRLWRVEAPDSEQAVNERETALGLSLPVLLRAYYLGLGLRDGEMLHVHPLGQLAVSAGGLTFASEQQGTFSWAIPLESLADPDPPLVFGAGSQWEPDRCKLGELLRGFAAMNRPFRDPSCDASDYSEARLVAPWTRHVLDWKSIQYDGLWTNGVAVLDVTLGLLGARTNKALRQAAASLDVDLD